MGRNSVSFVTGAAQPIGAPISAAARTSVPLSPAPAQHTQVHGATTRSVHLDRDRTLPIGNTLSRAQPHQSSAADVTTQIESIAASAACIEGTPQRELRAKHRGGTASSGRNIAS